MNSLTDTKAICNKNDDKPIHCIVEPPHYLRIGDGVFHSGCAIVEVVFPNMALVHIKRIALVNNYTAHLSLRAKIHKKSSSNQTKVSWKTVISKFTMMPNCHCEGGSQAYFTLERKDFSRSLTSVSALRFVLYQPSPNWKTFTLEELYIYSDKSKEELTDSVPKWVLEAADNNENEENVVEQARLAGLPDPDEVSKHLHEMLRINQRLQELQPTSDLGRFDVDGCYEINLLSYT